MIRLVAFAKAFALASVLLVVPAVGAGPVHHDAGPVSEVSALSWLESALDWVSHVWSGYVGSLADSFDGAAGSGEGYGFDAGATGSCIDPMGLPIVPCDIKP